MGVETWNECQFLLKNIFKVYLRYVYYDRIVKSKSAQPHRNLQIIYKS